MITYNIEMVSLSAASIVMQAQTYDRSWHTVAIGSIDCLRCEKESVAPFPMFAHRFKVDVVKPENVPTGLLRMRNREIKVANQHHYRKASSRFGYRSRKADMKSIVCPIRYACNDQGERR